jgi:LmbE family N-acetylglucosaminyl deacetylase
MTVEANPHPSVARALIPGQLPSAVRVLAVTARPGQESADLGGLLYAFRRSGASLSLLCLTRGSAVGQGPRNERVEAARPWEVQMAATILGVREVTVADYRDARLHRYRVADLAGRIQQAAEEYSADLVLIVAPEAGNLGDAAVARAVGAWQLDLRANAQTARALQRSAVAAHATQADALPELLRRVDRLDSVEALRWLLSPARVPGQRVRP